MHHTLKKHLDRVHFPKNAAMSQRHGVSHAHGPNARCGGAALPVQAGEWALRVGKISRCSVLSFVHRSNRVV